MTTPANSAAPNSPTASSPLRPVASFAEWLGNIASWIRGMSPAGADKYDTGEIACSLAPGVTGTLKASRIGKLVIIDGRLDPMPATTDATVRVLGNLPPGIPPPGSYTRYGSGSTVTNQLLIARALVDGSIEIINRTGATQTTASISIFYRVP